MSAAALVKCARCGEFSQVPWELLGDTRPEDITDHICDACDFEAEWSDDYSDEDFEAEDDLSDMYPLEVDA